jgi:hypothetical protein
VCTESKDILGRNLLAGPGCPESTITEGIFIQRSKPYLPMNPEDPYPKDFKYELSAGEYCNIHGIPNKVLPGLNSVPDKVLPGSKSTPDKVLPESNKVPDEEQPNIADATATEKSSSGQ